VTRDGDETPARPVGRFGDDEALRTALLPRGARGGRVVGLVVEGGGMRGAFAAGVARASPKRGCRSTPSTCTSGRARARST
jgi:predicted acylesterase/phospholipase RssA